MTATSAASTLGESWNRRHPVSNESFAPQPMGPQPMPEGLRFSPPSLATLDRPQGRVLVKTRIRSRYFCWICAAYSFQRRKNERASSFVLSLR